MDHIARKILIEMRYSNEFNPIEDSKIFEKHLPLGNLLCVISVNTQPHVFLFKASLYISEFKFSGIANTYSEFPECLDKEKIERIEQFMVKTLNNQMIDFVNIVGELKS